jgi:hypothetical protein
MHDMCFVHPVTVPVRIPLVMQGKTLHIGWFKIACYSKPWHTRHYDSAGNYHCDYRAKPPLSLRIHNHHPQLPVLATQSNREHAITQ